MEEGRKASVELASSGAEAPRSEPPRSSGRARKSLKQDIKEAQGLFAEDDGDDDDETDDEDDMPPRGHKGRSFLPPGGRAQSKKAKGSADKNPEDLDIRKLVRKGLAEGSSASDLMPLVLMSLVLDKKDGKRKKRDSDGRRDLDLLGLPTPTVGTTTERASTMPG